jgi:phage shock protein PspC (stress-responsive transcriptional regulator)
MNTSANTYANSEGELIPMTTTTRRLRRSRSNRMIGGVVAGVADYIGMDVSLARVLYVLISIFSAAFPGILVYLICWLLIPEEV